MQNRHTAKSGCINEVQQGYRGGSLLADYGAVRRPAPLLPVGVLDPLPRVACQTGGLIVTIRLYFTDKPVKPLVEYVRVVCECASRRHLIHREGCDLRVDAHVAEQG